MKRNHSYTKAQLRERRVRGGVMGTSGRPRLHVYRSNRYISAQVIDDSLGKTLVAVTEKELAKLSGTKTVKAEALGTLVGQKALKTKIKQVRFDRGHYRYHGRIRSFADAARKAGLNF